MVVLCLLRSKRTIVFTLYTEIMIMVQSTLSLSFSYQARVFYYKKLKIDQASPPPSGRKTLTTPLTIELYISCVIKRKDIRNLSNKRRTVSRKGVYNGPEAVRMRLKVLNIIRDGARS